MGVLIRETGACRVRDIVRDNLSRPESACTPWGNGSVAMIRYAGKQHRDPVSSVYSGVCLVGQYRFLQRAAVQLPSNSERHSRRSRLRPSLTWWWAASRLRDWVVGKKVSARERSLRCVEQKANQFSVDSMPESCAYATALVSRMRNKAQDGTVGAGSVSIVFLNVAPRGCDDHRSLDIFDSADHVSNHQRTLNPEPSSNAPRLRADRRRDFLLHRLCHQSFSRQTFPRPSIPPPPHPTTPTNSLTPQDGWCQPGR